MVNRRPALTIVAPGASPEEAAAVVAALERFMRETAPVAPAGPRRPNPWQRAALLEGAGAGAASVAGGAVWGDAHPWGAWR